MNLCAEWIFVICLAFVFDLFLFLDISPCFILTTGLRLIVGVIQNRRSLGNGISTRLLLFDSIGLAYELAIPGILITSLISCSFELS